MLSHLIVASRARGSEDLAFVSKHGDNAEGLERAKCRAVEFSKNNEGCDVLVLKVIAQTRRDVAIVDAH